MNKLVNGVIIPISKEEIKQIELDYSQSVKPNKLEEIKNKYLEESTKDFEFEGNTYKGGDSSASAIAGAVSLASALQEDTVTIIDAKDIAHKLTFDKAMMLSALTAEQWRDSFFRYKELKVLIKKATTVDQVKDMEW